MQTRHKEMRLQQGNTICFWPMVTRFLWTLSSFICFQTSDIHAFPKPDSVWKETVIIFKFVENNRFQNVEQPYKTVNRNKFCVIQWYLYFIISPIILHVRKSCVLSGFYYTPQLSVNIFLVSAGWYHSLTRGRALLTPRSEHPSSMIREQNEAMGQCVFKIDVFTSFIYWHGPKYINSNL